jgi:ABC-2 type transport system ATP-binding protein
VSPASVRPNRDRADRDALVVLEASGLRKTYGSRVALTDVSLEARRGELVACIGPNGAGKTTLLTILADIQRPDAGSVRRPEGRVGWVPQQPALYGKLSVAENLRLFARLDRVSDVEGTVSLMLVQTGLADRAGEQVARLSWGNRQRVNVAIGLLSAPQVLLLDEPSSALDPRQRERLWQFIGELAGGGTTVVYATHNVSEAERYAERVLVLADGERLFWGEPGELRQTVAAAGDEAQQGDFEGAFVSFLHQRGH